MSVTVADMAAYARERRLRDTSTGTTAVYRDLNGLGPAAPEHAVGVVPGYLFPDDGHWEMVSADARLGDTAAVSSAGGMRVQAGTGAGVPIEEDSRLASAVPELMQGGLLLEEQQSYPARARARLRARKYGAAPQSSEGAEVIRPVDAAELVLQRDTYGTGGTDPGVVLRSWYGLEDRASNEARKTTETSLEFQGPRIALGWHASTDRSKATANSFSEYDMNSGGVVVNGSTGVIALDGMLPEKYFAGTALLMARLDFSCKPTVSPGWTYTYSYSLENLGTASWRAMIQIGTEDAVTSKVMHLLSARLIESRVGFVKLAFTWAGSPAATTQDPGHDMQWYANVLFIRTG